MLTHPIGKPIPRKEGRKKVTGQALYVDDLTFPGMLHGVTVRSPIARGNITNISFDPSIPWDEFVIVTASDIPGANHVALILDDQPYLANKVLNHPEEPVLLLAHKDKYVLEEARRSVKIEVEELPAIFSLDESLRRNRSSGATTTSSRSFSLTRGTLTKPGPVQTSLLKASTKQALRNNCTLKTTGRLQSQILTKASLSGARCSARITFTKPS